MPEKQTIIPRHASLQEAATATTSDRHKSPSDHTVVRDFIPGDAQTLLDAPPRQGYVEYPEGSNERDYFMLAKNLYRIGGYLSREGGPHLAGLPGVVMPMLRRGDAIKTIRVLNRAGEVDLTIDPSHINHPEKFIKATQRQQGGKERLPVAVEDIPGSVWMALASAKEATDMSHGAKKRAGIIGRLIRHRAS